MSGQLHTTPQQKVLSTYQIGAWVGPKGDLDAAENRKSLVPA
jgi:hypothetical protein